MSENQDSARIDKLFERVIDLDAESRGLFLAQHCRDDAELRAAVEARLKAYDRVVRDTEFLQPVAGNLADISPGVMNLRCPNCKNAMEVLLGNDWQDIKCEQCGSQIDVLLGDEEESERIPEQFGCFRLVEKLGSGSFGSVWKAMNTELDRFVAIKVPRRNHVDASFLREARAAAQLRHPHIVSVHEIGKENDVPYIVSDFVDGETLDKWVATNSPSFEDSAKLFIKIASALQHAHEKGVIHRDLKPANIMVDKTGDPHIMDFGLAKRETGEITMTQDGQILGTPAYMPPEQAGGEAHNADSRSDVYALGVILYEQLTGELPFRGTTRMLIQQIIHDDPPDLQKLNGLIPKDLATICLKCIEKEPHKRYASAWQLRDEFQRWLEHRPIHARPISAPVKLWRWCKRKPVTATWAAISLGLLTMVAIASPIIAAHQARLASDMSALADEKGQLLEHSGHLATTLSRTLNDSPDSSSREMFNELTRDLDNIPGGSAGVRASFKRAIGTAFYKFGESELDPHMRIEDFSNAIAAAQQAERLERAIDAFNPQWKHWIYNCYFRRALAHEKVGDFTAALADLDTIIKNPLPDGLTDPELLANTNARRAHIRATHPDDEVRNAQQAVADANAACELSTWKSWSHLYILAEAYAEAGEFGQAIQRQEQADGMRGFSAETRLKYYRNNQAYRELNGIDVTEVQNVPAANANLAPEEVVAQFYAKLADDDGAGAFSLLMPDAAETLTIEEFKRSIAPFVREIQNDRFEFLPYKSRVDQELALVMIRFQATSGGASNTDYLPLCLKNTPAGWLILPSRLLPLENAFQRRSRIHERTAKLYKWFEAEKSVAPTGAIEKTTPELEAKIENPAADAFLTVEYPNGGEEFDRATEFTIRWKSTAVSSPVKIEIFPITRTGKKSGSVLNVTKQTDNDGEYDFAIPRSWGWNSYKLKVSTVVGTVSDESDESFTSRMHQDSN